MSPKPNNRTHYLRIQLDRFRDITYHLRIRELSLRLAILRHLEYSDLACTTWRQLYLLGKMFREVVDHARLR